MSGYTFQGDKPLILIPAYMPDEKLVQLCRGLLDNGFTPLVVNDGSASDCDRFFDDVKNMGCTVLSHQTNKGKGAAIKTGFQYCLEHGKSAVTADADGQHLIKDILNIARLTDQNPDCLILGIRHFDKTTPLKSKLGNIITRNVFTLINGKEIYDTQTGLRGFSNAMIQQFANTHGERYEYEMNVLLELREKGIDVIQEEITVVYIDDNRSSHFQPLADAYRIYKQIFKFVFISATSGILDYLIFLLSTFLGVKLLYATYLARLCSSMFNFFFNKRFVFQADKQSYKSAILRYYTLAATLAFLSFLLTSFLVKLSVPVYFGKLIADGALFIFSFLAQKFLVFQ